jgi:hypothetical protein
MRYIIYAHQINFFTFLIKFENIFWNQIFKKQNFTKCSRKMVTVLFQQMVVFFTKKINKNMKTLDLKTIILTRIRKLKEF